MRQGRPQRRQIILTELPPCITRFNFAAPLSSVRSTEAGFSDATSTSFQRLRPSLARSFTLLIVLHVYLAIKYQKRGGIYFSLIMASFLFAVGYWVKFGIGGPQPDGLGQRTTAYLLIFLAIFCMSSSLSFTRARPSLLRNDLD